VITSPEDLEVKLLHALIESRAVDPAQADASQSEDRRKASNTLPWDAAAFTGRDEQLAEIAAAAEVTAQAGRVVAIHAIDGMPGVGTNQIEHALNWADSQI
jgi:hypothetical protein